MTPKTKYYSGFLPTSLLIMTLLSGCSETVIQEAVIQSVFLGGEAVSIFSGRYVQEGVIVADLDIEGITHTVRAPVKCRSFVHPVAGSRVTRRGPDLYETRLPSQETVYVRIQYDCAKEDAAISLANKAFVRVYRLKTAPVHVVCDWAIPASHPLAAKAPVKILELRLDLENKMTNAQPFDFFDRKNTSSSKDQWQSFQAIYAWRIPLEDSSVEKSLGVSLRKQGNTREINSSEIKRTASNIHKRGAFPLLSSESNPEHISALLSQIPTTHKNEGKFFTLDNDYVGRRLFYEGPSPPECSNNPDCKFFKPSIRLEELVVERNGFLMFYDHHGQALLWVQDEWLALPVKRISP